MNAVNSCVNKLEVLHSMSMRRIMFMPNAPFHDGTQEGDWWEFAVATTVQMCVTDQTCQVDCSDEPPYL